MIFILPPILSLYIKYFALKLNNLNFQNYQHSRLNLVSPMTSHSHKHVSINPSRVFLHSVSNLKPPQAKLHSHNHNRVNSKSSFDSCDSTVDGSLSPRKKDLHSSFNDSVSSNENQDDHYTVLNSALNQKKKVVPDDTKFKTELCKNFSETGECPYGKKCKFAHGRDELNEKRVLNKGRYKSKKCVSFHTNMVCSYGVRCLFVHEQRAASLDQFFYEKFISCPDLLNFSLTQKKKRLPVFEILASSPVHDEGLSEISLTSDEEREMAYYNSF